MNFDFFSEVAERLPGVETEYAFVYDGNDKTRFTFTTRWYTYFDGIQSVHLQMLGYLDCLFFGSLRYPFGDDSFGLSALA